MKLEILKLENLRGNYRFLKLFFKEKSSYFGLTYWQAAKSRSKSFKNLEETGLVVGCCKHAIMLKALNMYQGEIYAYPLTLQWVISQDYSRMKFICQDVICKYFPWMMKVLDKPINIPGIDALRQCKPFLSVMHGKAHNWSCQVCNDWSFLFNIFTCIFVGWG